MEHVACSDCGVEGVILEEAIFNVVYVCPECGDQLACAVARE